MGGWSSTLDEIKKKKIAQIITNARQNSLAVKIRNVESLFESEGAGKYVDLSLKTWDVLSGLYDIAVTAAAAGTAWGAATVSAEALEAVEYAKAAEFLASGSSNIMETVTFSEVMEVAGPIVAWIALWVNLGSPYLEIKQNVQTGAAKQGISHGILCACQRRTGHSARMFAMRQGSTVNNRWIDNATSVAQNAYRMGFIAGFAQGKALNEKGKHIFWKIFGHTLSQTHMKLWDPGLGEQANDWWIFEAGGVFMRRHLRD